MSESGNDANPPSTDVDTPQPVPATPFRGQKVFWQPTKEWIPRELRKRINEPLNEIVAHLIILIASLIGVQLAVWFSQIMSFSHHRIFGTSLEFEEALFSLDIIYLFSISIASIRRLWRDGE